MKLTYITLFSVITLLNPICYASPPNRLCLQKQSSAFSHGDGSERSPYLICNKEQFLRISYDPILLSKYFILGNDINFQNQKLRSIGNNIRAFTGGLNGAGYTLSSLYVPDDRKPNGLFSVIKNASIFSLNLKNVVIPNFSGKQVGALAGLSEDSVVFNVNAKNINLKAPDESGGLIGKAIRTDVYFSSASGKMENHSGSDGSGGLVGILINSKVHNSFSKVDFTAPNSQRGISYVGGLIGLAELSEIADVYSLSNIDYPTTSSSPFAVAGLIAVSDRTELKRAYSAGKLPLHAIYLGGSISASTPEQIDSNTVFWDIQLSRVLNSSAGLGVTTDLMRKAFLWLNAGFSRDVWSLDQNEYPTLLKIDPYNMSELFKRLKREKRARGKKRVF